MPKHGACCLSSINVSEYVLNPFTTEATIDYSSLIKDIAIIVKAMDDIVEENAPLHALKEQTEVALKYRNIGIGICGLHDLFIKVGVTYGSHDSLLVAKQLISTLFRTAVIASQELANIRGNFPGYDSRVWDSDIIKHAFTEDEIKQLKKVDKLRNCSLLSIAPTGSIGTMFNVSTGAEPWFSVHYTRNTKSLEGKDTSYEVWAPVAEEANKRNWHPECLVTSNDISWKEHIDVQSVLQEFVDTAISKTINMPKTTTVDDIKHLYLYAWKKGLKGCTIYVDGSRDPILTTEKKGEEKKDNTEVVFDSIEPIHRSTLGTTYGCTQQKKCACGKLYITCNKDKNGHIVELFTHTSKGGICQANLNAVTRLASLGLRSGVKVKEIIDQLKGIHCPACQALKAKGQNVDGLSCPDIMSKALLDSISEDEIEEDNNGMVECPECHKKTLRHEGGCVMCTLCGYSKCN